MINILQPSPI